jgi:Beta-propeller repeat
MATRSGCREPASVRLKCLLVPLFVSGTLLLELTPSVSPEPGNLLIGRSIENTYVRNAGGNPRGIQQAMLEARQRIMAEYGTLPVVFEPNRGQARGTSDFLARGRGYAIELNAQQVTLLLGKSHVAVEPHHNQRHSRLIESKTVSAQGASVAIKLVGSRGAGPALALEELPGKSSYFIGDDPKKWISNVPHYSRIQYSHVYPGIDLVYYGNRQQLETDFIVAPGANPKDIRLAVCGIQSLERSNDGDLIVHMNNREIRLGKPSVYQFTDNLKTVVASSYRLIGHDQFAFEVPAYDATKPLIIDPVLTYSTYLGGSVGENGSDFGTSIAVDSAGNAYVTGFTVTTDFPTLNPVQSTNQGALDAFVTKLDPTGTGLVYSTYLGGQGDDFGNGIAVDAGGNAYVTGMTLSQNFPTTAGAFSTTCASTDQNGIVRADVFVTKLGASGSALLYSTCIGGSADDEGFGIAVDAQGNAHIAGGTNSTDFPVTSGAVQTAFGGGDISSPGAFQDAFVTELNASGSALLYSTFLGGCGNDQANGIALDSSGNAYITGETRSTTCLSAKFPTTPGSFQPKSTEMGPFGDAFVTKLDPRGSTLVYSTFLGGNLEDSGNGISVDSAGHAYVAGSTQSATFPSTPGAFQSQDPDPIGTKGFITKLSVDGSALTYSTFLGGEYSDSVSSIVLDFLDNSYVTGTTYSGNFPFVNPLPQPCVTTPTGEGKVFITKLNGAGSALFYSVCVGAHGDTGSGIAVDASGSAYVSGSTFSSSFVTTPGAFQSTLHGTSDAFILKLTEITSLSTNSIDFGTQPLGVTSSVQAATVTNAGTTAITVNTISLSGLNAADFQLTADTCTGQVLAAAGSCNIGVTFTPAATGSRSAAVSIADTAPDSPVSVALGGTGVDFSLAGAPSSVTVSAGQVASYSVTVSPLGGTFASGVSLSCSSPSTLTYSSCSLAPGSVTPGSNPGASTMTVTTTGPSAQMVLLLGRPAKQLFGIGLVTLGFMLVGVASVGSVPKTRRIVSRIASVFLLLVLCQLAACGGAGSGQSSVTPRGTYTITISGATGSLHHTSTVVLVVQ